MSPIILFALSLCWTASPDATVNRYGVYVDSVWKNDVATTTATVDGLTPGRVYSFKVTAKNTDNLESDPSNELRYVMPVMTIDGVSKMVQFQIPLEATRANCVYHFESTTDLKTWKDEPFIVQGETGTAWFGPEPFKFYRVRIEIQKVDCAA